MKVFWQEKKLWNKAKNIFNLYKNNFLIPKTFFIEKNKIKNFDFNFLKQNKKYILRPSFEIEDWTKNSFAWYFKSIFPVYKKDIISIFKKENLEKFFNWNWYKFNSIIIQEFIESNIYGVYFTRNPNNIFKKWFYEISDSNDWITSWKEKNNKKLSFIQEKELETIWKKLENIFKDPQDIEFTIKNNKIILLQTRSITTWNNSIYSFSEIQKINWIYQNLDFDELWEKQDYFSYIILKKLFDIIYLDWKIYFKKTFLPNYLFKKINTKNYNLNLFYQNYKKYLFQKIIFNFIKFFTPQKLDKEVLKDFFKKYSYTFLLEKKSNLDLKFNYKTNYITNKFLKLEKQKNKAFYYLEQYKKEYSQKNFFWKNSYKLNNKLIFLSWIILNNIEKKENYNWIYKWKIKWIITDLANFSTNKKNQVLILENLDFELYDKLDYISGVIIKNWNSLSHNAIILREYKIPSIINYKDFWKLKIWKKVNL
jgi:hypothetical protein